MKILIIDNYDSFTYNLYQYCGELLQERTKDFTIDVIRNDAITLKEITQRKYNKIILSPGPGDANDKEYFGICADTILQLGKTIPILGACLGMQGIAYVFGGKVTKADKPMHGKTSIITHSGKDIFKDIPQDISAMRYHSLIVSKDAVPSCLTVTATVKETGEVMGLRHKTYPIFGVQFHPESFATDAGQVILENFLFGSNI